MTPAGMRGRLDNTGLGDSSNDAANLQQASDDLRDDGSDQDDLESWTTRRTMTRPYDDSSGGDDLA